MGAEVTGTHAKATSGVDDLEIRLARIEKAISTMAWWLTQTPDSFGHQDARGIDAILKGESDDNAR